MTEDTALQVGDTVSLKSGGHVMTVASIKDDIVTCDWSLKGDIKSKDFATAELKKADASPMTLGELIEISMKPIAERDDGVSE